jgi:hypothetical protein
MGVKLTTHLQLVMRSRKRRSVYPLPHIPSWHNVELVKHRDYFTFDNLEPTSYKMRMAILLADSQCSEYMENLPAIEMYMQLGKLKCICLSQYYLSPVLMFKFLPSNLLNINCQVRF